MSSRILVVNDLTTISLSDVLADKNLVAPKLSLINVPRLNYLPRSKIFVSEDGQLQAAYLILDYEPISCIFQDVGQALRAGNPKLTRVDVSKTGFLVWRDLPPVVLPSRHIPQEVAAPREETASTHLSIEAEIDQFYLDKEGEAPDRLVEVSNFEVGFDRSSAVDFPRLVVSRIDTNEEEEEDISLNQRRSLRDLLAERNKGSSSKEAPKSQVPPILPPFPPLPPTDLGLNIMKDLKKKRPMQDLEEGEVASQKGMKQQKITKDPKDKRFSLVDSREEQTLAEVVRPQYCTWSPRLEVDGAAIPWNAFIQDYQRGHSAHVAEALK